jgi:exonuclease VII small subunit
VVDAERTKRDRGMLEARYGRLPGYAGGGMVEDRVSTYTTRRTAPPVATNGYEAVWSLADAADGAARGLKGLEKAAGKVEKAYDRQQSKLEDLISQRDSLASSIASSYLHDPFGNGLAGFDAQLDADSGDIQAMTEALATLVRNGLSPKSALYQALAASADVNTAQQLAQLSSGELASRAQRFEQTQSTAAAFGGAVAGEQFNQAINRQSKVTEQLERRLHSLEDAIRDFRQHARKDVRDGAAEGAEWGAERGSEKGTRAGNGDRTRRTAAARRAGG